MKLVCHWAVVRWCGNSLTENTSFQFDRFFVYKNDILQLVRSRKKNPIVHRHTRNKSLKFANVVFSYLFIIITAVTLKAFTNRTHEITSTVQHKYTHKQTHATELFYGWTNPNLPMCIQTLKKMKELLRRDIFKRDYLLFSSFCRCTVSTLIIICIHHYWSV